MGWLRVVVQIPICVGGFSVGLWIQWEVGVGLVRVSRKCSPSVPGSSMVSLMYESMELRCS